MQKYDNIDEYFNEVQNLLKQDNPDITDKTIKGLKNKNIQAIINQNYTDKNTIEKCVSDIIKITQSKMINKPVSNDLSGDRSMNRMESKLLKFNDFVNEKLN
jgi:ABC-type antimicrobial peptide transport system ATPase subunit